MRHLIQAWGNSTEWGKRCGLNTTKFVSFCLSGHRSLHQHWVSLWLSSSPSTLMIKEQFPLEEKAVAEECPSLCCRICLLEHLEEARKIITSRCVNSPLTIKLFRQGFMLRCFAFQLSLKLNEAIVHFSYVDWQTQPAPYCAYHRWGHPFMCISSMTNIMYFLNSSQFDSFAASINCSSMSAKNPGSARM